MSNLPTVWTNVLAALVLSGAPWGAGDFGLLAFSLSCFYAGGMCLNDLWDLEADRVHRPRRPLPSGRVPKAGAWALTIGLFGAGLGALALARYDAAVPAGLVLLAVIAAYDRWHKDQPWSVLLMASCRLLVFAVVGLAVAGALGPALLLGGLVQFVYVLTLSAVARAEPAAGFPLPVVPLLVAGISVVDGLVMGAAVSWGWFLWGVAGAGLALAAQRWVRGD